MLDRGNHNRYIMPLKSKYPYPVLLRRMAGGDNRESGTKPERSGHCERRVRRKCHCESEKARRAMMRKPGNLLDMVWVGIFRRKRPVRRMAPLYQRGPRFSAFETCFPWKAGLFLRRYKKKQKEKTTMKKTNSRAAGSGFHAESGRLRRQWRTCEKQSAGYPPAR